MRQRIWSSLALEAAALVREVAIERTPRAAEEVGADGANFL